MGQPGLEPLEYDLHRKMQHYVKELNFYQKAACGSLDFDPEGFEWIDADNEEQSIIIFLRRGKEKDKTCIVLCNFTLVSNRYRIGVPYPGSIEKFLTVIRLFMVVPGKKRCFKGIGDGWHKRPLAWKLQFLRWR